MSWPDASLDRVARLRILAATLPGVIYREYTVPSKFADTWAYLSDLERSVPEFDRDVRRLEITHRTGTRLRIRTSLPWRFSGLPIAMDVELAEGWCWMTARPRLYVVGMAAQPHGDGTHIAHCEGLTLAGSRALRTLAHPLLRLSARRTRRHVDHDIAQITTRLSQPRNATDTATVEFP